ncbi:MAG: OmpH family outer membrane protein [Balneolaceae bacterium]|nr:OmpH family outer membrane protein [Balneolaceae bacterium]
MFRKLTGLASLLLFLCVSLASAQVDRIEIGFVNTQEVMNQLPERQQIQDQLNTFIQQKQQELQQASTEFQNAVATYQQNQSGMTQDQINQREQELTQMEQNLNQLQQTAQQEIAQRRQELLGPIYERINQAIQAIAQQNGLDMVLSEITAQGSNIVYYSADSSMDITQQVIQRVNSQSPDTTGNGNAAQGNSGGN